MTDAAWWDPYLGLDWYIQTVFFVVLAITASSLASVVILRLNGVRGRRFLDEESVESQFLWVFMVPALNEDVTIADSVSRLQHTQATHRVILVIDDGSDDGTADVLASIDSPDLHVLHRVMPEARKGKSAALNDAWSYLHETVLRHYPAFPIDRVVVVVVDADGRLSADAPAMLSRHFRDPRVAGVQSRVRIYNRRSWLTWCQDIEFAVFAGVFQLGRSAWGTANMGGNGQANRLIALDSVANEEGPWRHRLTEDQDVGVRLIEAGWRGAQDLDATVEQQGVSNLRRLYRQRTRWAQGSWQSLDLLPAVRRADVSVPARLDMLYYLLTPILQLATGVGLVTAVVLALVADLPLWASSVPILIFFLGLSFGPTLIGLLTRGRGLRGVVVGVLTVIPYTVYSWLIFPVLVRALIRHLSGAKTWAKTAREPLEDDIVATVDTR